MEQFRAFLRRKNIVFSAKRYGVDALGAMAQGLFCTLLVGTILNTLGTQFHIGFLSATVVTVGTGEAATAYTIGGLASAMVGPAMWGLAMAVWRQSGWRYPGLWQETLILPQPAAGPCWEQIPAVFLIL